MKKITVAMPCYNEKDNVKEVYAQAKAVFAGVHEGRA